MNPLEETGEVPLVSPVLTVDREVEFDYATCMCTIGEDNVTVEAIYLGEAEEKHLVIFPKSAWHKTPAKRILPTGTISRPMALRVDGASVSARDERLADHQVQVWMGYVDASFMEGMVEIESAEARLAVDHPFAVLEDSSYLPHVQALAAVAMEHFNFVSAESAGGGTTPRGEDAALDVFGPQALHARMEQLEDALVRMSSNLEALMEQKQNSQGHTKGQRTEIVPVTGKPKAKVHFGPGPFVMPQSTDPAAGAKPKKPAGSQSARVKKVQQSVPESQHPSVASKYPSLDPSVVSAAMAAGVEATALEDMERMMARGASTSRRLREPAIRKTQNSAAIESSVVLSESEDEEAEQVDESGSAKPPAGGVDAALGKLTEILTILTVDKVKKLKSSKVDLALDAASATSTADGSHGGGLKRAAAARRALRQALVDHPEDISAMVEKLMYEDLSSQVLPPGVPPTQLNARAWIEHRSRIGPYKTAAHTAWCAGGILDDLVAGRVAHARARAGLLLLQLDQTAIDRGSWTFSGELSLEPGPPMSALSTHTLPAVSEGESPFSRLLDGRWAEIALSHLRDTEEFVSKRKALGKREEADKEDKPKPKPKPKVKASGEGKADA